MSTTSDPQQLALERDRKVAELRARAEEEHTRALASRLDLEYVDARNVPINGAALTLRPKEAQIVAHAVILSNKSNTLTLGSRSTELPAFIQFAASLEDEGYGIHPVIVSKSGLAYVLAQYEKFAHVNTRITGEVAISEKQLLALANEISTTTQLTERLEAAGAEDVSIIIELLLGGAIRLDASDIHVEPLATGKWRVRYRIDGVLHDLGLITKNVAHLLLKRIKLLASLKLNVSSAAQDGRFTIHVTDRDIEIRASTLPGPLGEYIVLRLLDPRSLVDIPQLGLREDLLKQVEEELSRPNGMILTTGPTGSGKTTMLYAFVKRVASSEVKVITIEDPIEYKLDGIEQTQVDAAHGYSFAEGLRSIVRQDPDIVLIGEIRDNETAEIALQAALTGHLVFSTLHTNDAAGAIPRLIELGSRIETTAPAINVVMAQRLTRRLCEACAETFEPDDALVLEIKTALKTLPKTLAHNIDAQTKLRRSVGCEECHGTGYKGRIGVFELFRIDDDTETHLTKEPSNAEIRLYAIERGMVTLQQDALLRVLEGITTIDEVIRITGPLREPHLDHDSADALNKT